MVKVADALKTLLDYVKHTTNLEDGALNEIKSAVETLDDYLLTYDL